MFENLLLTECDNYPWINNYQHSYCISLPHEYTQPWKYFNICRFPNVLYMCCINCIVYNRVSLEQIQKKYIYALHKNVKYTMCYARLNAVIMIVLIILGTNPNMRVEVTKCL